MLFLLKTGTEACGTTVRDPNIAQNAFKAVSPSLPTVSVDLVVQDLPTGNVFTICYCPTFDGDASSTACDADAEFTHEAAVLTVRGTVGSEDFPATAGVAITIGPFTGQSLQSTDQILFMSTVSGTEVCGIDSKDAATEMGGNSHFAIATVGTTPESVQVDLSVTDLPKGGVFRVCYCHGSSLPSAAEGAGVLLLRSQIAFGAEFYVPNALCAAEHHQKRKKHAKTLRERLKRHRIEYSVASTLISVLLFSARKGASYCLFCGTGICGRDIDYTTEAGQITVHGADGIGEYRCVRNAPVCSFTVSGTSLLGKAEPRYPPRQSMMEGG